MDAELTSKPQVVQLLVKMYIRRSKSKLISFEAPFPPKPQRLKQIYKNVIAEGLKIQAFINDHSTTTTWEKASQSLKISTSKIAHLLKIVNNLPANFIEEMKLCNEQKMLKTFSSRKLLKISRFKTKEEKQEEIKRLLSNSTITH